MNAPGPGITPGGYTMTSITNPNQVSELIKANKILLAACRFALKELEEMTTDEFSKGGDQAAREILEKAIRDTEGDRENEWQND